MEDAVKRFVWPALKTLIAVIVAVALVKIAFFPSQSDGTTADISPGYAADVKTVPVTKGSISNTVDFSGEQPKFMPSGLGFLSREAAFSLPLGVSPAVGHASNNNDVEER